MHRRRIKATSNSRGSWSSELVDVQCGQDISLARMAGWRRHRGWIQRCRCQRCVAQCGATRSTRTARKSRCQRLLQRCWQYLLHEIVQAGRRQLAHAHALQSALRVVEQGVGKARLPATSLIAFRGSSRTCASGSPKPRAACRATSGFSC